MPELPEVETVRRELDKKLKGLSIQSVEVRVPKIVSVGPKTLGVKRDSSGVMAEAFEQSLIGQMVVGVKRRAKLLMFEFGWKSNLVLLVHLKMTGQFIFEDARLHKKTKGRYRILNKLSAPLVKLPYKHTHVIFNLKDGSRLYFNDVRKFGYLKLLKRGEIDQVRELKEYGPEPLSREFSLLHFSRNVKKYTKAIKQVLMDNKIVVGIGNIYSDEILFHAGIDPRRRATGIKDHELRKIFENIKPVLKRGIAAKGSSVGDFIRTDGSWGTMGKYHFVYGRKKQPCKICGTIIESVKLGGRTASFCPNCQK